MIKKISEIIFRLENYELSSIIKSGIYIVILSALIGFTVNLFNPRGFILIGKAVEKNKNIVLISSEEAGIKKDSGSAIFIDARQDDEFKISHIQGAINIPAIPEGESEKKIKEYAGVLSGLKELIIYCDGISCGASDILAKSILQNGYTKHIYVIKNGFPEWIGKGFPVDK